MSNDLNIFSVNKPKGPTSFAIVSQVKKIFQEKKVGHAGTLDPLASGVLVVAVGRQSTKKLSEIVGQEKEYIADVKLGAYSTTDDEEGEKEIVSVDGEVSLDNIKKVLKKFEGVIEQIPPVFSAIKVKGRRSYKLARAGQDIKLESRPVEIKEIEIVKYKYPDLQLRVLTGKGAYIRSLARDIGKALKTGGYLSGLKRTRVGSFTLDESATIEEIREQKIYSVVDSLKKGDIGVLMTDTIYGLVGSALNKTSVERIYKVKGRRPDKPFIILINSLDDLKKFKVSLTTVQKNFLNRYWPGKLSVVLTCSHYLDYLCRGGKSLAFRLPDNNELRKIIALTGPLVAPSANPEGKSPAKTINQAIKYFGKNVDFYFESNGNKNESASTLIDFTGSKPKVLRQGQVKVE